MKKEVYAGKVVVITGGSSGIGLAVAKKFAQRNAKLVLIARDEHKLQAAKLAVEAIRSNIVLAVAADVSNKEDITNAINRVGNELGSIDVLINCAGTTTCGRFADQSVGDLEKCLAINYSGAVYASKAGWPWLKKARGQLSFVSSVAGYVGLIGYSSYAPAKFAMTGLAECLLMEGKDEGIRVSIIYPPDTDTPLFDYEHEHGLPETLALSKNIKVKTPEAVAKKYLVGLENNWFEIYCDIESPLLRWFKTSFPSLFRYLTNRIIRKDRKQQLKNSLTS